MVSVNLESIHNDYLKAMNLTKEADSPSQNDGADTATSSVAKKALTTNDRISLCGDIQVRELRDRINLLQFDIEASRFDVEGQKELYFQFHKTKSEELKKQLLPKVQTLLTLLKKIKEGSDKINTDLSLHYVSVLADTVQKELVEELLNQLSELTKSNRFRIKALENLVPILQPINSDSNI